MTKITNRTYYFDYLRIAATLAVVVLHVAAKGLYLSEVGSFNWHVVNIYDSITRWCVPIFVMISGSLFLKREFKIKDIIGKYALRIVTAFCFWSMIYTVYYAITADEDVTITKFIGMFIRGEYHLWFCFMIVCLYLIVPFLKKFVDDPILVKYFLILCFLFAIVFNSVNPLLRTISNISQDIYSACVSALKDTNMLFVCGYVLYFVGGYYLSKIEIKKSIRLIIYILGLVGFAATAYFTATASIKADELVITHYNNFSWNVLLEALALFVFAKYNLNFAFKSERINNLVSGVSKCSFGAYLVHIVILYILMTKNINAFIFNPVLATPVVSIVIFLIALCISAVIHKIPFLNKYIV